MTLGCSITRIWGTFTKNVVTTFLAQMLSLFLGIANAVLVARLLGPEGKGILAVAMLVPQMLGLFFGMGINIASTQFLGSRRLDVPIVIANSLAFTVVMSVLGSSVVGVMVLTGWLETLVPGIPIDLLLIALFAFPLSLLDMYFSGVLQGLQRITELNMITLVSSCSVLGLVCIFVWGFDMGVVGAVIAYVGSTLIKVIVLGAILAREVPTGLPRWNMSTMRSMFVFGLRGHIGNVVHFFNYRLDMFLVNFFLSPADVGIYTISVRIAEILWVFPRAVAFVIFPKAAATTREKMNRFTPKVFWATLGFCVLSALGLVMLGNLFIQVAFGDAFVGAYKPLLALLPGAVLLGNTKVLTSEIAGRGYPQYNSISAGVAFVLTVILDLWLIPRYGILGASVASSIAYAAVSGLSIVMYLAVRRKL